MFEPKSRKKNIVTDSIFHRLQSTCKNSPTLMVYAIVVQKQPSRGVFRESCSENMQQIYRRTPIPNCDLNKVAKQLYFSEYLFLRTSAEGCFWLFLKNFEKVSEKHS